MKPNNPFLIEGYYSPDYFCDREEETANLISAVANDRNVALIAPRRMGKSGLVRNVFHRLGQGHEYRTAYIDIFGTQNLAEFVKVFATGVFSSFETTAEKVSSAASMFLKGFRPTWTVDAFGSHKFSFDVSPQMAEATLAGIFDYLESREFRTVVALDEFQQIAEYPEKGTEALLRSRIQFLTGHQFIFAGSRQHLMSEMFVSAKRPFYHSTQLMHLAPIDREAYYNFANFHFAKAGRALERNVFEWTYDLFNGITWYVQAVMNRLYELRMESPTVDDARQVVMGLVREGSYEFQTILVNCTDGGVRLLKAIAREGVVAEINSSDFIARHDLRAASSVNAALKTLKAVDLVTRTEKGYAVYDRLFSFWLANLP